MPFARYPNIIYLLIFPKKIWNFGLANNNVTLPSSYLGQARWLLKFLDSVVKASFFYSVHLKMKGYRQKCMFGFLVKNKVVNKTKLEFFNQIHSDYLAPKGILPCRNVGVLVEKVPKTYFVGVAWTLHP